MAKKKPSWIKDSEVRKKLPKGKSLPKRFDAFIAAEPELPVEWDDIEPYGLKPEARQEVLPFMRTYTGGLVSFWWHAADPAVIHLGDEGQLEVLALNFDEFLKGAVLGKSGVEDLDNAEPRLAVKGVTGKPSKAGLAALQKKFDAWWKANKSRQDAQTDLEGLRGRVMAVAEKMLADGLFKKLVPTQDYWKAEFRIQRTAKGLKIGLQNGARFPAVPSEYGFTPIVEELLQLLVHKDKEEYGLVVTSSGLVSIDKDKELLLMSAELKAKLEAFKTLTKKK